MIGLYAILIAAFTVLGTIKEQQCNRSEPEQKCPGCIHSEPIEIQHTCIHTCIQYIHSCQCQMGCWSVYSCQGSEVRRLGWLVKATGSQTTSGNCPAIQNRTETFNLEAVCTNKNNRNGHIFRYLVLAGESMTTWNKVHISCLRSQLSPNSQTSHNVHLILTERQP